MFTYLVDLFSGFRRWFIRAFIKKAPVPYLSSNLDRDTYLCPECHTRIPDGYQYFCRCCGVRFDWVKIYGY